MDTVRGGTPSWRGGAQATAWEVGNNSGTREGAQPGGDMPCRVPYLGYDWGPGLSYLLTTASGEPHTALGRGWGHCHLWGVQKASACGQQQDKLGFGTPASGLVPLSPSPVCDEPHGGGATRGRASEVGLAPSPPVSARGRALNLSRRPAAEGRMEDVRVEARRGPLGWGRREVCWEQR